MVQTQCIPHYYLSCNFTLSSPCVFVFSIIYTNLFFKFHFYIPSKLYQIILFKENINLGIVSDTEAEIKSGLSKGEELVLNPGADITNGVDVIVSPKEAN